MTPRFSSLTLLSVQNSAAALDRARLYRLHRHRCIHVYVSALTAALFSLIPGLFFYLLLNSQEDPVSFPRTVKLGLVLFTGSLVAIGILITYLILRQIWVDPIYQYLQSPHDFELAPGQLIGGEVDRDSDTRRQGLGWTAEIKYTLGSHSHTFFESFSKNIMMDHVNLWGKEERGFASYLPAQAWILRRRAVTPSRPASLKTSLHGFFWVDLKWVILRAWQGPTEALIGLEAAKIEQLPRSRRSSYTDIKWGIALLCFFFLTLFFFTMPGIPDGRWLEVQGQLTQMDSLKTHCEELQVSLTKSTAEDVAPSLQTSVLAEDWFKAMQFTAWNVDSEKLSPEEEAQLRKIFLEDCREKVLTDYALQHLHQPEFQKIALYWLDDIAKSPRSLARLEMAKIIATELARRIGTPEEQKNLQLWTEVWTSHPPYSLSSQDLIRWIQRQGRTYAEWQYPFQGRVLNEATTRR